jgi:hypothetical protein
MSPVSGSLSSSQDIELVQSWVLIAIYESMRAHHQQAWMSAGHAFRLVQLMKLHEIDGPAAPAGGDIDYLALEERRRIFWMAYFIDHLFSMRNNWPTRLNEHVVSQMTCCSR